MNAMNAKLVMSIVFATAMMFCATVCCAQNNVVYYGANSNALDVVFVDTNLSTKMKLDIVTDLNLCLREWGKNSELRLQDNLGFAGYLYNPDRSPHYPNDVKFPRNIVSNGTVGVALQITKDISDAYTNAFVSFISSTNFPSIPPKKFPDYYLENQRTQKEIIEDAQKIISQLTHQTYYPPSALGFGYTPAGPSGIFSKSNLWMRIPCSSPSGGDWLEWGAFPAMWHKGRWKFCFWDEEE